MRNALMASTAVMALALAGGPTLAQDQSQDPAAQPVPPTEAPAEAQGAPVTGEPAGDAGATAEAPASEESSSETGTTAEAPASESPAAESGATAEAPAAEEPASEAGMTAEAPASESPAPESGATAEAPAADEPSADTGMTAETPEAQPAEDASSEMADTGTADTGTAGDGEMFVTSQDPQQAMANDMIGAQLLGPDDEAIGSVTDLVLDNDNKIIAAVVGVGGFLGLGEKEVAISIDQIEEVSSEAGQIVFRIDASKEVLEEAPEFVTVADQEAAAPAGDVAPAVPPATTQ